MAGRPIGTTKDSSRKRVINPNGRKIDYEPTKLTSAYMKWIKQGYKLTSDETKLVFDRNFNPETVVTRKRGRPKSVITTGYKKVKNPDSGREIKTNTQYFRKLVNKYGYDKENNRFLMYITDPRNADRKIVKNDETFKKYTEKHGYIYDEKENSFSIPSQKSAEALNSGMKCYELKIVNKDDPLVQMNQLDTRINFLLNIALKKQKGIKFNLGFKIKFIKTVDGVETKDSSTLSEKCITVSHKSEIKDAVKLQKEGLLRQIDRFTNGGSGLRILRITRNFINIYKYKPLRARGFIILPDKINNKKATINIQNKDDKCFIYCLGKKFNKLFSQQTKHHGKKYFCKNCIQCFSSVEVLEKHNPNCIVLNGTQKIELPKEGSNLEFKSLNKTITVPFVIYADLEALLKPLKKCENIKNDNESYTIKTHEHKTCSYGHKVVCYEDDKYSKPYRMFRGKDAIYNFFEALFEEEKQIDDYMKEFYKSKMFLTQDDWKIYNQAKCCYVCKESFTGENYKVRDHCHITCKFRGPACKRCNLQLKLTHTIPVIFHNLRGYDSHLLLQELGVTEIGPSKQLLLFINYFLIN